jgi:N-acetylneuraminic acid mutarotase
MQFIISVFLICLFGGAEAADQWEQKANFGGIGRHRGAAFAINNKGYMGFGHINSVVNIAFDDFWEYDPATDSWTQKADFAGGLRYHNLVFSVNGKGYTGLGRDDSDDFNDMWEYDPTENKWTALNDFPGGDKLGAVSFVIDDVAYVGLGEGFSGNDNAFYRYNQLSDTWTQLNDFPGVSRNTGVAFAINGKGYVGTGNGSFGTGNDFWEYKPLNDQWIQRATVPGLPREGATGFAVQGKGYIFCGNDWNEDFKDVWEFDPGKNSWTQVDNFPGTARRFMQAFVIHDKGYCGTGTNGVNFNDFWRFDPSAGGESKSMRVNLQVQTFPNPSVDYIRFKWPEGIELLDDATLVVCNSAGLRVHQGQFNKSTYYLDKYKLGAGIYFYSIIHEQQKLASGQFIFQ